MADIPDNPAAFDAVQYVEKNAKGARASTGKFIGAVAFVAKGIEISMLSSEQAQQVLTIIYEKHADHALIAISYNDDIPDSVLRSAYETYMCRQEFFDFVVCTSLVAFYRHGSDYVSSEKYLHEISSCLPISMCAQEAFIALKDKIDREDFACPWIRDCANTYGKDVFSRWLDAQIAGIEGSIRRNHPFVKRVGAAAGRPSTGASHTQGHFEIPGYQ